jgi:hypothetical protein
MSISWLELALSKLNNGSCVEGERGDIEGCEDDLRDDDSRSCWGSVGEIDGNGFLNTHYMNSLMLKCTCYENDTYRLQSLKSITDHFCTRDLFVRTRLF